VRVRVSRQTGFDNTESGVKDPAQRTNPKLAAAVARAAAATTTLLGPLALGATGDLDPGFADVGRLGPMLYGPAWSVQLEADDSILLGGGNIGYYGWYYYYETVSAFVDRFSATGSPDPNFNGATLDSIDVFDVVRQADGRIIAVGTSKPGNRMVVFRLAADGTLDTTFGDQGVLSIFLNDPVDSHLAASIVLDPDGRMIIAGSAKGQLAVLALMPDGSFDSTFANAGVFTTPDIQMVDPFDVSFYYPDTAGFRIAILRSSAGGYRVTTTNASGCQVVALTGDGALDSTFGSAGIATTDIQSAEPARCSSMVQQDDGRLLIAGSADGHGFVVRALADGQPDATFSAAAVWDSMNIATAVATDTNGGIAVAGTGLTGASIMRLQATGELDTLFGDAGSTSVDLPSTYLREYPEIRDMTVDADDSVIAAGGIAEQAFVVRLLGTSGGDSPGVLGIVERSPKAVFEGDGEAIVTVRRSGGSAGEVSVAYETAIYSSFPTGAVAGQDYTATSGRLTWADGDTAEQQIHVPILADNTSEGPEAFSVGLSDIQGGAGYGAMATAVQIEADGNPGGQFNMVETRFQVNERDPLVVAVCRDYYTSGAVSVAVSGVGGAAEAGADFEASPVTLTWADNESACKSATIAIRDDHKSEGAESFTVRLSNPTGGAVIGARSTATVSIAESDRGGGGLDWLSVLFLGFVGLLRRAMILRRS